MKLSLLLCLFMHLLLSCSSSNTSIDCLQIKQSKYFLPNSSKPYTGEVVFKHYNGEVSNIFKIKNGVPDGEWIAYGYKKEIVQKGFFKPIDLSDEIELLHDSIARLNVCTTKEGEIEFTDILLITDVPNKKSIGNERDKILAVLKKHSIAIKGNAINEIKYVRGELSN